jgi:hypothetical protein
MKLNVHRSQAVAVGGIFSDTKGSPKTPEIFSKCIPFIVLTTLCNMHLGFVQIMYSWTKMTLHMNGQILASLLNEGNPDISFLKRNTRLRIEFKQYLNNPP